MYEPVVESLRAELDAIREAGTWKAERRITSPQNALIRVAGGPEVLNFCANNYLGLADDPRLISAAHDALDRYGFGMASVRFICGTLDLHIELERIVSHFLGVDDTILYGSCFDANGGVFEALCGEGDAIVSDALNHASIIDGIRLSKAARYRAEHDDLDHLDTQLRAARQAGARRLLYVTDGVFSMDGDIARLDQSVAIAERHGAMVMVDDSHATGFVGATGRGSIEHRGVMGRVDIVTSTLGKALGGASGGFAAGRKEIVALLRQRSRPYLFSNTLAPSIAASAVCAFGLLTQSTELRDRLERNALWFRRHMTQAGFQIRPGTHPICPVMLGDAALATRMADAMLAEGIYVIGFSYPVVPKGAARIRVQISAAHTPAHLERAVEAFVRVGRGLGVISSAG